MKYWFYTILAVSLFCETGYGRNKIVINASQVYSERLQDYNSFDFPEKIKPKVFSDTKLNGKSLQLNLPPGSVIVLALKTEK